MTLVRYEGTQEVGSFERSGRRYTAARGVPIDVPPSVALALPAEWAPEPVNPSGASPIGAYSSQGPVASRAEPPPFVTTSNGTDTGANVRIRHLAPMALTRIKLRFANQIDVSNQEADQLNQITLKVAVEYPAGTYIPVFFSGLRSVTLDPGAELDSDWIELMVPIPANTAFYSRTYVTVTSGKFGSCLPINAAYGEAGESGTSETDKTTSGTITGTALGVGPSSIIADLLQPSTPRVFVLGDSIAVGYKDAVNSIGWVARSMEGIVAYQRCAIFGETGQNAATVADSRRRLALARGCNVGLVAYGTNDISGSRTLAQVQADLTTIANGLLGLGMTKVYVVTLPPRTSSTDSWATIANQTAATGETIRQQLNTWIRTSPAPFSGFMDVAQAVEVDATNTLVLNGGFWLVNGTASAFTSDGIHPDQAGYTAVAAAIKPLAVLKP